VGGGGVGPVVVWVAGEPPLSLRPGDAVERADVRLIGLPGADDGVALVLGLGGGPVRTVLWAPGPGPLPQLSVDALAGARLDVAVLAVGPDDGALGLAHTLAQLRGSDAFAPGCDVVAVGFDHVRDPHRLAAPLSDWGVRVVPDGAVLGPDAVPRLPDPPLRTLLLGPAASGKSAAAEALLAAEPSVDYLPTGPAPSGEDRDWAERIAAHRRRRPPWWRTLEGADLATSLATEGPPLLVDSIGTWVADVLERTGAWDDAPGWPQRFDGAVDAVAAAWRQTARRVVAVAEETGWGVVPASPAGRRFRDRLGAVTQRLAAESEQVTLVVAGRRMPFDRFDELTQDREVPRA
jgi:adenosylcobinamide kinase/adenosylcobinamide-phosphate guanylyltransferase